MRSQKTLSRKKQAVVIDFIEIKGNLKKRKIVCSLGNLETLRAEDRACKLKP